MTLKETLLQELEAADDALITATIDWVRSHKHQAASPPASGAPIQRGSQLGDLLEFAGTWAGEDLADCLESVYATRSKSNFSTDTQPFE
jgi:hypothetical protein